MCRKLDARVAEKVMDLLSVVPYREVYMPYHDESVPIPHYSTDHNAAFEVVDKLTEGGIYPELRRKLHRWTVVLFIKNPDKSGYRPKSMIPLARNGGWVYHKSLLIAICLAALRAKGDDEWVDQYLKETT